MNHADLVRKYEELPMVQSAYSLLRKALPSTICYHTLEHTRDVLSEALFFGSTDNLSSRELELLAIAAAFHDTGFTQYDGEDELPGVNEQQGATIALNALADHAEYSAVEKDSIRQLIIDTTMRPVEGSLRQVPSTKLAGYLLDADTSNFGRDDFFKKVELVFKEQQLHHVAGYKQQSYEDFLRSLPMLLKSHHWNSPAAKQLREEQKQINLTKLIQQP